VRESLGAHNPTGRRSAFFSRSVSLMSAARSRLLAALLSLVLAAATLLMCRGLLPPGLPEPLPGFPTYLGRPFTLPITLTSTTDLRPYVLFAGLAGLLILVRPVGAASSRRDAGTLHAGDPLLLFEIAAGLTLLIACFSALWNDCLLLSRGWILSCGAGAAWAILLARFARRRAILAAMCGASIIVLVGGLCTIWHRWKIGPQLVDVPIGPVTMLGGLGALWSAFALGQWICQRQVRHQSVLHRQLLHRQVWHRQVLHRQVLHRQVWHRLIAGATTAVHGHSLTASAALVVSIAVLIVSERQTAYLAFLAASAYTAIVLILARFRGPRIRSRLVFFVLALLAIASAVVLLFWYMPGQTAATKLSARMIFWSKMAESFRQWWALGHGPDMFVCRMTTALAPWRSEHPRALPGNVDLDAHNEWFQAFYELGVLGGCCYLAMPLIVLGAVTRRFLSSRGQGAGAMCLPCGAALVAVLVGESASINLRYPTFQAWYWSLLGVALALVRPRFVRCPPAPALWRLPICLAAGACLIWAAAGDLRRALAHAEGRANMGIDDEAAAERLAFAAIRWGSANWLAAMRDLGNAQLTMARGAAAGPATGPSASLASRHAHSPAAWADRATRIFTELYRRCAGYPGAGFRLAEALHLSGRDAEALEQLSAYFNSVDPHDQRAIELWLSLSPQRDTATVLLMLCRALRNGEWDPVIEQQVAGVLSDAGIHRWDSDVDGVRLATDHASAEHLSSALVPEMLRLDAIRWMLGGDLRTAADRQIQAAEIYRRIAIERPDLRRSLVAEVDVWHRAAELVLSADRTQYRRAFELISQSERMALAEAVVKLEADTDGQTAAIDLRRLIERQSDRFQKMWYLSAMLHLATDQPRDQTRLRVMLSLPVARRGEGDVNAQLAHLAGQVVRIYEGVPAPQRPANYEALRAMGGQ